MSLKSRVKALWNDESAQGATEYILVLVAAVVVAMIFKKQLTGFINDRLTNLGSGLSGFDATEGK